MTRFQIFAFSVLHAISVLLLPLLITLLGGCLETEKLQVPPEARCEDVQDALNGAISFTPSQISVNDFVHTQESVAPLSNNPQVTADVLEKLISTEDKGDGTYQINLLQTVITYQDGQAKQENKEAGERVPGVYQLCPSPQQVTYHGLRVYRRQSKVTEFKDSCGSYENCEIEITEIKFDQVFRFNDGRQDMRKYDLVLSKDVPYIARNLKSCMSGTIDVNGQPLPVTQCSVVKNFGNQP